MAQDKKSFLMYCDWLYTVEKLDDEQAGKLLKHLLRYVNDKNPEPENNIIDLVFEPIKLQLKRDLKRYESIVKKRSEAGKASARKRQQVSTSVDFDKQTSTNPTDIYVTDTVNDTHKYSESVFLENWKSCREYFLKKPTNLPKLTFQEKNAFQEIVKDYSKEDINNAMKTLFSQERVPSEVMWLRPKHFLEHFETYFSGNGETKIYSSKK